MPKLPRYYRNSQAQQIHYLVYCPYCEIRLLLLPNINDRRKIYRQLASGPGCRITWREEAMFFWEGEVSNFCLLWTKKFEKFGSFGFFSV
jgi:hypothetical protein